ncbi:MAG TPA: pseudouridine synthase [Bacteroidia bacterium]|nr:pseudouridine synthase [Bacteroidia bacterium]
MNNQYTYCITYKPYGMLSQFTPEGNKPALGSLFKFPLDCYPVGQLETESEGLLLLTNDKKINHKFLNPTVEFKRTYYVQVDGDINEEAIDKLRNGIEVKVEGKIFNTKKAIVEKIEEPSLPPRNPPVRFRKSVPTSWISITLSEQKNKQVRSMLSTVGFPALRIVRMKMGNLELKSMLPGDVVELKSAEVYDKLFYQVK